MENLKRVLLELGEKIKADYIALLRADDRVASGNLTGSVRVNVEETEDNVILWFELADYWEQIEDGRLPTQNGGDGALKIAIAKWIDDKGIVPEQRQDSLGRLYTPSYDQLAFLIARNIHRNGYIGGDKATGLGYLWEATTENSKNYIEKINDAAMRDFYEEYGEEIMERLRKIRI